MSDEDNERTKQAVEEYWRRVETVEPMVTFAMHEIVRIETIPTGFAGPNLLAMIKRPSVANAASSERSVRTVITAPGRQPLARRSDLR
jgi:hypothetical protein